MNGIHMHIMHDFWFCVWYFGFLSGIASSILVYAHALLELGRNHPDHRSIRQHIISVDPNAPHGHAHWGAWAGTSGPSQKYYNTALSIQMLR